MWCLLLIVQYIVLLGNTPAHFACQLSLGRGFALFLLVTKSLSKYTVFGLRALIDSVLCFLNVKNNDFKKVFKRFFIRIRVSITSRSMVGLTILFLWVEFTTFDFKLMLSGFSSYVHN